MKDLKTAIDEAVAAIRKASKLAPDNSQIHSLVENLARMSRKPPA